MAGDSVPQDIAYLRSLRSVRERCTKLYELGVRGELDHFDVDLSKVDSVTEYVLEVTKENYPDLVVPFHSRWRHFPVGGIDRVGAMTEEWKAQGISTDEIARRLLDLAVISVLLDAGAGDKWAYDEKSTGQKIARSEGLAVASFYMFRDGYFSSSTEMKDRVDADALEKLQTSAVKEAFQVSDENPLVGAETRAALLVRLGTAMRANGQFFERDGVFRPGHILDYLRSVGQTTGSGRCQVSVEALWTVVIDGFEQVWPKARTSLHGYSLGDVWHHPALLKNAAEKKESEGIVPFHKLSQWLTYSLMEPLKDAGIDIEDLSLMTGLPEYRNGGLLIDLGMLKPKHDDILTASFEVQSEVIIEWRALIVASLDVIGEKVREKLGKTEKELPLVAVLQGGTWTAGRKIAKEKRGGLPPISIISDGTVF